jgi:hypothetical protein
MIRFSSSIPDDVVVCTDCDHFTYDYSDMYYGFCALHDGARIPGVTIPCKDLKHKLGTIYQSDIDRRYKYPSERQKNPFEET